MNRTLHSKHFWPRALGSACIAVFAVSAAASTPPYPQSQIITAITWDFSTLTTLRKAQGSDIWPLTWAKDGNLYGAWGDGGGFQGDNTNGRVSVGFAAISGTPVAGNAASFSGTNIWGLSPTYAQNRATFGGKIATLLSVKGTLYAYGGFWTTANCGCSDPTQKSESGPLQTLVSSADLAASWTAPPTWTDSGAFLNFGQDYWEALDGNVYIYYTHNDAQHGNDTKHVYLKRVPIASLGIDPAVSGAYQYLTGVDANGNPISWSSSESNAAPIFTDNNDAFGMTVYYDAAIGRYLATVGHDTPVAAGSAGQFGVFEAPNPWGPWATVDYEDNWGNLGSSTGGDYLDVFIPTKWMGADGKTFWATTSGVNLDSFNTVKATLTVSNNVPAITAPTPGITLTPGQNVTAQGTGGSQITWSVDRIGDGLAPFASGSGASITFTVPADSNPSQVIRIMATGSSGARVYRDYHIGTGGSTPVGYWKFDEGTGTSATDSSGNGDTGTLTNQPTWVTGKLKKALNFTGTQVVQANGSGSLANLYTGGMTVSAWINPAGTGGGGAGRIVDKDNNNGGWFLAMSSSNNVKLQADQFDVPPPGTAIQPSLASASNSIVLNTWQHVAATWDGSTNGTGMHIYVNGAPADGTPVNGSSNGTPFSDAASPLGIGNRGADLARGFNGSIDDVRVYNRVLSAAEIQSLAHQGVGVTINSVSTGKTYTLTTAQAGALIYTDRTFTIASLPTSVTGGVMIQTANDDKIVTVTPHLTFTLDSSATVYVIYDGRATQLPAWLGDGTWTATGQTFTTNETQLSNRAVYKKSFAAGQVSLGGNLASPATGPSGYSDYFVIVVP